MRTSIYIDPLLLARVDERAELVQRSRSNWVSMVLEAALRDDTQATKVPAASAQAAPAEDVATRTRAKASATGPVTARGASRPGVPPPTSAAERPRCDTCARLGPPKSHACPKCGHRKAT